MGLSCRCLSAIALASLTYGQSDLSGVWLSNSATPLERPAALAGKAYLTDAEVVELKKRADKLFSNGNSDFASGDNAFLAAYTNVEHFKNPAGQSTGGSEEMVKREFENRTSLIVDPPDGRIPALTPEAVRRLHATEEAAKIPPTRAEQLTNPLRCLTFGVPRIGGNFGAGPYSYYRIVQSKDYVAILPEMIHDARIIPLDGRPHLPSDVRQWNGDPRGHWEDKTLVVDTTNFSPQSDFMGSRENLHLVERFTRVAPAMLKYEVTIEDPSTWTRPWTASINLKQSKDDIYEAACHEGNYDVMVGMLWGNSPAGKKK